MRSVQFHFAQPQESPGYLLWQVSMLWQRKMKRGLDRIGLTHTQFVLLAALGWLSRGGGTVTQVDVANHGNIDRMMTSKVLRTLQGKGFVRRTGHLTDTRAKSLSLTPAGEQTLQQAISIVQQVDDTFFAAVRNQPGPVEALLARLMRQGEAGSEEV
jgi:DNA-binding MarR family transcriptional regulator